MACAQESAGLPVSVTRPRERQRCAHCLRPQNTCFCPWVTPVETRTEVLILQHPMEANHAKNTARLLHLSLPGSRLLIGESLDEDMLRAMVAPPKYTMLLYPATDSDGHATPRPLDAARLRDPSNVRLVVLDGTWRKSRKMLHLSPLLQGLPRMSLRDAPPSGYVIRKAHKPGQLSTLEATCAALSQLEGDPETLRPLLAAFDRFIAQQRSFRREKGL